jgi:plastocyanin
VVLDLRLHFRAAWLVLVLLALGPAAGSAGAKPRLSLRVSSPPPEHRAAPGLRTYVFRLGGYRVGGYETFRHTDLVKPPPVKGSIVGMDVRSVDRRGRVVPQNVLMLHHILFTNSGPARNLRDGSCPRRRSWQRFYGASEDLRAMTFPRGYGYPTHPRSRWKMIWMLMNHRARLRDAYVEYRVTVDTSPSIAPVKPLWLSVVPCSTDPQYTVPGGEPPGAVSRRSRLFGMPATGRIVAIGGHMHGGSKGLGVAQPRCGNRTLFTSRPTYGLPGDPLYRIKPLLHEPDPKYTSWFQSAAGWPVQAGEALRVDALYDGSRPHMRVMGIAHVYVAPGGTGACGAPPGDSQVLGAPFPGRPDPPAVKLTLAALRSSGRAVPISAPRGRTRRTRGNGRVLVRNFAFRPVKLSIRAGRAVRWVFRDRVKHDATLVSGPRGFASPTTRGGRRFRHRFTVPGTYRIYCSIHPTEMSEVVRVRRR